MHVEKISKNIDGIDVRKLSDEIERYLDASISMDDPVRKHLLPSDNIRKTYHLCYDSVEKEISVLLSRVAVSLDHFLNFRFSVNGNFRHDPSGFTYFKQLKSQQIGLLMTISDETEMLRNLIRQSAKMRFLLAKNSEPIQRYTYLTEVLRERLEERPTTLLKMHGKDEKIQELNQTLQEMNSYESGYSGVLQEEAEQKTVSSEFAPYLNLVQDSYQEIRQYRKNISAEITEFRHGWEFFRKLIFYGVLPKIRKPLNDLIEKDRMRKAAFRDCIYRCRRMMC